MSDTTSFWDDPFDDSDYFTGPPLTEEMIRGAEAKLGYRLPQSYLRLIQIKNGGSLKRNYFLVPNSISGAEIDLELSGICGISGNWTIENSPDLIQVWGYPDVGIVIGVTPSSGHDTIMFDYSECGPQGEPRIIHVETECTETGEPEVSVLAPDFETFLQGLVDRQGQPLTTCTYCSGSGKCYCIRKGAGNVGECPRCNGSGKCHLCGGKGKVPH